jgi:hypothetical protein
MQPVWLTLETSLEPPKTNVEEASSLFPVGQSVTRHSSHPLTWTEKTGWKPILFYNTPSHHRAGWAELPQASLSNKRHWHWHWHFSAPDTSLPN